MPRVSRVEMGTIQYGWMFDIQTFPELMDWMLECHKNTLQVNFHDAFKTVSAYGTGKLGLAGHAREGSQLLWFAEHGGLSLIDALGKMEGMRMKSMLKALTEHGRIFINTRGAYFHPIKATKVIETRDMDVWAFPEDKPIISRWRGGTHYYAKIGGDDVVWDGREKWDTYTEAEEACRKFQKSRMSS